MAWDDDKQVAPGTEEGELTPEEWNEHVADQKNHSERHESNGDDELSVDGLSGDLADEQDAKPHDIGGATHTADTLANLNSKVSDATLDDTNDPREPESHAATHEGGSDSLNVFDLTGDLVGQGLERVNDTLQVLSSIWDGANVVADVDNTNTTTQALEAESVTAEDTHTERIGSGNYHYAGDYSGNNPDDRLSNALDEADEGDAIYLEAAEYGPVTIEKDGLSFIGTNSHIFGGRGTVIDGGTWTINGGQVVIEKVGLNFDGVNIQLNTDRFIIKDTGGVNTSREIVVDTNSGDGGIITNLYRAGQITFNDGSEDSTVGPRTNRWSVTDNGNNNVIPLS